MMKKLTFLCLAVLLTAITAKAQTHKVTNMDAGWRFHLGDVQNAEKPSLSDAGWRLLNVPHDWSIEGENLRDNPGGGSIVKGCTHAHRHRFQRVHVRHQP